MSHFFGGVWPSQHCNPTEEQHTPLKAQGHLLKISSTEGLPSSGLQGAPNHMWGVQLTEMQRLTPPSLW